MEETLSEEVTGSADGAATETTTGEQPRSEAKDEAPKSGYTIQLLASPKALKLNSSELKNYRGKCKEYTASGRYCYKYCYGVYATKKAAEADLKEVRKSFKDAYVVHFTGSEIK